MNGSASELDAAGHVREIVERLEHEYGAPTHGNKADPLDELIYIKLSQQTNAPKFEPMFEVLLNRYPGWQGLERASESELAELLRPIGFHRQRARHLVALAKHLSQEHGRLDLSWLKSAPPGEAVQYLAGLPGVGLKTALCVAMYSLGQDVLPVDIHVQRVSERLGLLPKTASPEKRHRLMAALIPEGKRRSYHVTAVAHGRLVCRKVPKCQQCILRDLCRYYQEAIAGGPSSTQDPEQQTRG